LNIKHFIYLCETVAGDWLSGESVHIILKTPYLVEEKCEVKVLLFTVSQRLAEDTAIVNSSLAGTWNCLLKF